jgi:ubiquinone/menaquinone biosynthesis C-methylase UbiE
MTLTSISRGELEPPPWLYALMAQGSLFRRVYRRFVGDLAASLPTGITLLDVGTGPGYLLAYLAPKRPDMHLFGLDRSYRMIDRGQRRQPGRVQQKRCCAWLVADAAALPFPNGIFDQVIATFSFHIWPQPTPGLTEILRVLRRGGRAWIYEMKLEASTRDLRQFAREEKLLYPLVYLGFKTLSWHHALRLSEVVPILQKLGAPRWNLRPVHHLFWRMELEVGAGGG